MNSKPQFTFPQDFFWGASTSAHQVEGGNANNWSEWEKENAPCLAKEALQKFPHLRGKLLQEAQNPQNYISGKASDHWHRFEEDFALLKSLGMNAYRFSIEWSRIEPREGEFDPEVIGHYQKMIAALLERGIEPLVTLWHWTIPLWLRDQGGWASSNAPFVFERYVEKIVGALGSEVQFWLTLNEPEVYIAHSYLLGEWPPQKRNIFLARKVKKNLISAHRYAWRVIRKMHPQAQIGIAHALVFLEPFANKFINRLLAIRAHRFWNEAFLRKTIATEDFIGVNFYFRTLVDWRRRKEQGRSVSDLGWELHPEGIYEVLKNLRKYGKPLYITENGLADADDSRRAEYLREVLFNVAKTIQDGVDVRGYLHWSLLDNFEWDKGFWPRFGLIEVDYRNGLKRRIRPSAWEYARIIREGLSS